MSIIFDEVQTSGNRIVVTNNHPECVLISPEQYEALVEMLSDYLLLTEADKRMAGNNDDENISHEEMMDRLDITREDLDATDVESEI